jgi:hypothetical protein
MKILALLLLLAPITAQACDVHFGCNDGRMTIDGKSYPIVCDRKTGENGGGTVGSWFRANGKPGPGKVAVGTPMIPTSPPLCFDCFVHVASSFSFSNGCVGTSSAGFRALQACSGSKFTIARR